MRTETDASLTPVHGAEAGSPADARDRAARVRAVDPRFNVALEASAGTGKTRVLVDRYVNLLRAGVDPANILAMTFTRKAAAEMRERILARLRAAAQTGEISAGRWRELRERMGDIAISTIDAFCLSLLREFPLEADLDPGFTVAEETETPRYVGEALDRALRICRSLAREDEHVALAFAQLGERRLRAGLADLLAHRLVAPDLLRRYLASPHGHAAGAGSSGGVADAATAAAHALLDAFTSASVAEGSPDEGLREFVATGPAHPVFMLLVRSIVGLEEATRAGRPADPAAVAVALARAAGYFLTQAGTPRSRLVHARALFPSERHWSRHRDTVVACAPRVAETLAHYRRTMNALVARGVWRAYRIAEAEYRRTLDAHAVLDFPDLLLRTLDLLRQMEEFARSRYRLESRYHHVLLDEFQDTSRAQWELVALLVQSWGAGAGLASTGPLPPSIFLVGDRKQSIYGFRDADVSVLSDAARFLEGLRPDGDVRRSISRSFRSVPPLLAFVNDVCADIEKSVERPDAFRYEDADRFPVDPFEPGDPVLGAIVADDDGGCAEMVASEIERLLSAGVTVRDVATGVRRAVRPGDVAVLFRTRDSHRGVEAALARRAIPCYVHKGLGFFDADEVRDLLTTMWHLADPASNLRAAAWLRSGFVGLSDEALRRLAPAIAESVSAAAPALPTLDANDAAALALARASSQRWVALVDRLPPAELLDLVLSESAYLFELRGERARQAWENVKKVRAIVRRIQNRGYATLARVVAQLERLALGDESNAAIEAHDAVSLMTIHAAKGLEFPVVVLAGLTKGTSGRRSPIRAASAGDDAFVAIGDFESEADADEQAREREETKRLLYVAMTRARDRLYLSAAARNGRLEPARGSLAEVMPGPLLEQLARARVARQDVRWRASSGAVHAFHVPAAPNEAPSLGVVHAVSAAPTATDFGPLSPRPVVE